MTVRGVRAWMLLIARHLAGQGAVTAISVATGLLLLRILPIEEFALYTLSVSILQMAVMASEMGLAQAVNTIGARSRDDRTALGTLYVSACTLGNRFYVFTVPALIIIYCFAAHGHSWSNSAVLACLFIVVLTGAVQVTANIRKSVLNIHHDATALLRTGLAESLVRLVIVLACAAFPHAATALVGTLLGAVAARYASSMYAGRRLNSNLLATTEQKRALYEFILPLLPVLAYHTLQGQLSILILSTAGLTTSVAQVGALGRLGQLITIPMLLNGFVVQPIFSRIRRRSDFIRKGIVVLGGICVFATTAMASAYIVPDWWLTILGRHYGDVGGELPIAMLAALLVLLGGTLYTMVISRNSTRGQWWYIVTALAGQSAFLFIHRVHSTADALLLNLVPATAYSLVQIALLCKALISWERDNFNHSRVAHGV
jgi:O-antigen/teichoic acid export membrane protein